MPLATLTRVHVNQSLKSVAKRKIPHDRKLKDYLNTAKHTAQ
jgi:hypothetical protein